MNSDCLKPVSCTLALALLTIVAPVRAQVLYGSLVGAVTDSSQAAVPGARVKIVDQGTNLSRETLTNEVGYYAFNTLPPGVYSVTTSREGFKELVRRDVTISQSVTARVDAVLEVGAVSEKVLVSAQTLVLQTESAEVRSEIPRHALQELPLPPGRNYEALLGTLPGFTPPTSQKSIGASPSRSMNFFVNGTNSMTKNTRIDGASQTNIWLPDSTAYIPSLEAIETVNVVTNSFDGEQGLAGGVAINVLIKSGSNQLHGSGFEYHNDTSTKAKPVLLPGTQAKPRNIYNQFGGTVGGAIKKDKLFYFLSYEGVRYRTQGSVFATVPTVAMVRGDMSGSPTPMYDPATGNVNGTGRLPFADKQIPVANWDPIIKKILPLIPAPNVANALTSNYFAVAPYNQTRDVGDAKINWNPTSKMSISGRVGVLKFDGVDTEIFGELGGPPIVRNPEGDPGVAFGRTVNLTIAGSYVVTPRFVADTYFGWTDMRSTGAQANQDKNIGIQLGIPGTNGTRSFEGGWPRFIAGWTGIQTSNFSAFGTCCPFMPFVQQNPQWNYVANGSWTKSTHNLRFGGEYVHQGINAQQAEFPNVANHGPQGGFGMTGGPTSLNGGPSSNLYNEFATFLLGLSSFTGRNLQVPDYLTTRAHFMGFYVQDKWQATSKLTVSLGLRYEYYPFPTRDGRGLEKYNFTTNQMGVCGIGVVPTDCGVSVSGTQFAPRIGLAYRVTPTFVIRGGYGIAWDPFALARQLRTNYPTLVALNLNAANGFTWATKVVDGIPLIPTPALGNGIVPMPGNVALTTAPDNLRRGYIQSWNLTMQKLFGSHTTIQAAYVATRQTKELGVVDYNAGQIPGLGTAGQPLFSTFGRTAITNVIQSIGTTHYDALQATASRRFAQGITWNFTYTWSKAIGVCCQTTGTGGPAIQAFGYQKLNHSLLPFNIPNYISSTAIAELPFGKSKPWVKSGVGAALLGGWQVNMNFSVISGLPFNVTAANTSLNAQNNTQRANLVKSRVAIFGNHGAGESYFDPLAFAPVTTASFGTAGYEILKGPTSVNLDLGVTRKFKISERFGMELRADAFNAPNHPHWGNPAANVSTMSLNPDGRVRGASQPSPPPAPTAANKLMSESSVSRFDFRSNARTSRGESQSVNPDTRRRVGRRSARGARHGPKHSKNARELAAIRVQVVFQNALRGGTSPRRGRHRHEVCRVGSSGGLGDFEEVRPDLRHGLPWRPTSQPANPGRTKSHGES